MSNSQRLVLAIIDFLNQSIDDGTVKADDKESLEVAIQCIGEAFGVDPTNESQQKELSIKPATLQTIFDVFMKTRSRVNAASEPEVKKAATAEEKAQADKLKAEGNSLMSAKKYDDAIEAYTKAIALDPSNPVYYSNRAAAYSSKQDHLSAVGDAEMAISVDPKFIKLDPSNASLKSGLQNAKARIAEEPAASTSAVPEAGGSGGMPDLSSMANMMRGMGGGGGGAGAGPDAGGAPGMPDIAAMMQNPQMRKMAEDMMKNGTLQQLMSNPAIMNMVRLGLCLLDVRLLTFECR
ncbi:TPR-like protein [Schizophyllum commune H4-8]|uniref:TPR-like protein n=1 Tax=Schizophyllum commune (strain H4-8 / FGSC 9210) TaxID=578458 RepID=UPI00216087EE|nr:TPR-like protein [Schizophyllum commune H4-8]KAI5897599.1 TPR-like protein [Schizophyllum commune H4-8]